MTEPTSPTRAVSRPPAASDAAERWSSELIEHAASIRLLGLFTGATHAVRDDRALYRSRARRSIQVAAIETLALREEELVDVMRFRLAQYLAVRFVDLERIYDERILHEPLDHASPRDVHIIAADVDSGEILSYITLRELAGAPAGTTFRMRDRPLFPVEEVHGWGIFNRLNAMPDIELTRVREVGRFVKNQRYSSLDERSIRGPVETSLAMWHVVEHHMQRDVDAFVGDFEEGIAMARLAYFHVPMAVLHGTVPYEAESAWLYRRYRHRTVFPFAVRTADLPLAHARMKSIDRAMSLPGKLALIRLSYLRRTPSPNRSSLEPAGGLPAIDEALVLTQPDVAMADRLTLIHEGDRLRQAPLFADLSVAEAAVLGTFLERILIESGTLVLREGDEGDALFVVESGSLEVRIGDMPLAELGPGDHFGEIAILTGGRRTADVVATAHVSVLRLSRDVYLEYLAALPDVSRKAAATSDARSLSTSIFAGLSPEQASMLGAHMERRAISAGDVIVREGELGDAVYLIVSGAAEVAARESSGGRRSIASLGPGDVFGEIALLSDVPRIADVVALTPMVVTRLDRQGFDAFLAYSARARASLVETAARRRQETARRLDSPPP